MVFEFIDKIKLRKSRKSKKSGYLCTPLRTLSVTEK